MARGSLIWRLSAAVSAIVLANAHSASATELAAPSGITGAGTRMDGGTRAWGELGFTTIDEDAALWAQLGVGLRLTAALEIEALLPVAGVMAPQQATIGASDDGTEFSALLGNPYLGVNLLALRAPELRVRVGAGVTLPVTSLDDYAYEPELLPLWATGSHDAHLWQPGGPSLVVRSRVELERAGLIFSLDLAGVLTLNVADPDAYPPDRTPVVFLQPALELAGYASSDTLIGLRLPLVYDSLQDELNLSAVPFLRHHIGDGFVAALLTLNLAGPHGFEDGDGPMWGFQLGAGLSF